MHEYRIDIGNSSSGPVGAVLYIKAKNRKKALAKLPKPHQPIRYKSDDGFECLTYVNPDAISIKDVKLFK